MGSPAAASVSVEEYLSNPAYEHCEYIDGAVSELNVGNKPHSTIQINCGAMLREYLRKRGGGYVASELRCRLKVSGRTRFYLPDVSVVLGDDSPEMRFLERAPDLVVEVRSPDDSVSSLTRKMADYFANGAKLTWLILPEERSVLIFAPKAATRTALAGETLDGGDLLPGLKIPVDELFG
jgi:Uma2 family endonuclease